MTLLTAKIFIISVFLFDVITMRTFIAVDLPPEVKDELKRIQSELKAGVFKFTNDFHITLQFLGEKTEEELEKISSALSQVRFKKFSLTLDEVGVFPSRKFVRVIWVGTSGQHIYELQKLVNDALSGMNIDQESPFLSHITIARVKQADKEQLLGVVDNIIVKKIKFDVPNFKLKKSTLTNEGPIYEDIKIFDLF